MKKSLFKSTFIFSLMTAISRVTGLCREMVFAYFFGATAGLDAFNIAYRIPNFLRNLLGEGAFSQAFVPVLSKQRQQHSQEEIRLFLSHMAGLMILVLSTLTIIAVLITPWLVYIFAPGFTQDPNRLELTTSMLRVTFPYILFISLTAYVSGILNSYGRFGVPAFAPNLLNLSLVGAATLLAPHFTEPVKALAWGIFIGGLAQLLFQLPFLYRLNLMSKPRISWHDTNVKKVLKLMIPAIFGVSVAQISFLIDNLLASFLPVGSISWLNYSNRLTLLPLGLFGVAIATVVLPHLSRKYSSQSHEQFSKTLDWALKFVLTIAPPAAIGITMLAGPIVATLFQFQHGQFLEFDVVMVKRSLFGFAVGIPSFMLVKVLASGFYATQNIKTPVKIAAISMLVNIMLALILIFPLKHAGLALATSITSSLNASLLFWHIRRRGFYNPNSNWKKFWLCSIFANSALAVFLWLVTAELTVWFNWSTLERIWHLSLICVSAIVIYFISLRIGGTKIEDLVRAKL